MPQKTEQYRFAESVIRKKMKVELFDNRPYTTNLVVRAQYDRQGVEYGVQTEIRSSDAMTIGQALDVALQKLMEDKHATEFSETEEGS